MRHEPRNGPRRRRPGGAEHCEGTAAIVERHLRSQHEHLQPLADPGRERARQQQEERPRLGPQQEIREHSSLRRAVRAVDGGTIGQAFDVAAQLAVQKRPRIRAARSEHAVVRKVGHDAAGRSRRTLAGRIAEVADDAVRDVRTAGREEGQPFGVHYDSRRAIGPRYYIGRVGAPRPAAAMFRALKYLFLLTLLAIFAGAGWLWWFAHEPLRLAGPAIEFTIPPGSSLRAASRTIARAGVDMPPLAFEAVARAAAKPGDIKAGTYEVTAGTTPLELLGKLTRGEFALVEVKFIEGWTFRQLREALDAHPHVRHDTKGLPDAAVLQRVGLTETHPEGLFFPDTYRFARGTSDVELLRAANRALAKRLDAAWADRRPDLPLATPVRRAHPRLDRGEGDRPGRRPDDGRRRARRTACAAA